MRYAKIALAAGAALALAGAAEAKKPSIWVKCDGYPKPEGSGAKLAKGLAAVSTLGIFGMPEAHNPEGRAHGEAGAEACRAALADPAFESASAIRRARLHQAFATHQLEAGDAQGALATLDAAVAAAGENAADPFFRRSTGVALEALRAFALMRLGRQEEALASAWRAAEARPWSTRVQMTALALNALDPAVTEQEVGAAERLRRLDPSLGGFATDLYLRSGRHAEAWALLKAERAAASEPVLPKGLRRIKTDFAADLLAAYAAARSGEGAAAEAILADVTAEAKATAANLASFRGEEAKLAEHEQAILGPVEQWRPMIAAATALAAGDAAAAQDKLLASTSWPAGPLLGGLIGEIRAALPAESRRGLVAIDPAAIGAKLAEGASVEQRVDRIAAALYDFLPEPEDETRLNGFSKQFGLGLKPTGFKSKKLENGLVRIEYAGSKSPPLAVEEMTMLRAAQLALEGGHKGFVIEKRADLARYSQMTYGGSAIGDRTLMGYVTQLDVRFTADAAAPGAVDAQEVVAALKPVYVRSKPPRS